MTSNVITIAGHSVTPVTLTQAIEHFLQRKRLRNAALNTLVAYAGDLQDFADYATTQGVELIGLVGERLVGRWLDRLGHRGLSPRSQARKLTVLRQLVLHSIREGWLSHDPTKDDNVHFVQLPKIAPELQPLLAMMDALPTRTPQDLRDRAMLRLTLDAALRVGDLTGLDVPNPARPAFNTVDLTRCEVRTLGKGRKPAVVPINKRSAEWLADWLRVRDRMAREGEAAIFVSNRGTRITRQQIHNRVRQLGEQHGMPGLHPHLLRHRRVGDVVEQLGLEAGQHLARHRSKSTTASVYGSQAAAVVRHVLRERADLDARRVG
ncbi:MAG TPA: tyrosine-type recombinase/integrase [Frateuria sp.]|uniref:site-specific integrase n=1 Tax=Frateuria sp. TaxID=2211372 RepID=UPI002D7E6002|nr:tyrosine-type recombinase/integrase [Frateuria sp.]HET6805657.1 tyrosine-type recombinase/integrase [Frateuria sp.]